MEFWTLPSLTFAISFLAWANFYAYCDVRLPQWYTSRALSPDRPTLTPSRWLQLLLKALWNILLASLIGHMVFAGAPMEWRDTWLMRVTKFAGCYLIGTEYFGWAHCLIHKCNAVNAAVHRHHHEWTHPIALAGLDASLLEMLLLNIPLGVLPPFLLDADPFTASAYTAMLGFYIANNHSGHQLLPKWVIDVSFHDHHHRHPSVHFGSYLLP
jgi:sterol desaturase/sphingolipid hydroxylase (fatty acid hydroxylase superfamily)